MGDAAALSIRQQPLKATVCELTAKPEHFSGKDVVVRASILHPRRMALEDDTCGRVLLAFPEDRDTKPKPRFTLVRDANFKRLMASMAELVPPPPLKPGKITATFEGRFDSVFFLRNGRKVERDPRSIRLARDEVRLVLRRVTDVEVKLATDK